MKPIEMFRVVMTPAHATVRSNAAGVWLCAMSLAVLSVWPSTAPAIQPAQWVHTTEADFDSGETHDTVITNLGDIKLATQTELVHELTEHAGIIYDLQATVNGDVYIATGPEGKLLRRRAGKIEEVLSLPNEQIFALDTLADGRLLIAVSAPKSRLAVLDGDALKTLVDLDTVRYVWDLVVDADRLFVATGTEGKLLLVNLGQKDRNDQPKISELLDTAQNNLLCLARGPKGRLYAGSDRDGLVYRITVKGSNASEVFVLYDAPEPEIGALLVTRDGTVFAGTADADQARPGRLEDAASDEAGRPETINPTKQETKPGDMPRVQPEPEPMAPPSTLNQGNKQPSDPTHNPHESSAHSESRPSQNDPATLATPLAGNTDHPAPADPTASQRDRLRQVIRQRLKQARQTGTLQASTSKHKNLRRLLGSARKSPSHQNSSSNEEGNAIYRISPDGFVTEVFRESVMILKLIEDPSNENKLLVATGNEGQLFQVEPAAEETTILVDLEPQQVPAMVKDPNGRVLLGTANPASLVALEARYADSGTYTSPALDAKQISHWGKIHFIASTPKGTSITIETRSGNVQDPDQAVWSDWSPPQTAKHQPQSNPLTPREVSNPSPRARFLQYRLTLNGHKQSTPVVDKVWISYMMPNLKPIINSIHASYPEGRTSTTSNADDDQAAASASLLNIQWEASDPNDDQLLFSLEYQPAGIDKWLLLAEHLDTDSFEWQTLHVPDGWYLIRMTASDSPDNPTEMTKVAIRRADPVLVDNTPPTINLDDYKIHRGTLHAKVKATDMLSPIRELKYNIDSEKDWHAVLPNDLIHDSTQEVFTLKISDLQVGPHVVAVRVKDHYGNTQYKAILLEVK